MSEPRRRPLPAARRLPLRERLSPEHPRYLDILAAHERALDAGEHGYLDPSTGAFVFTALGLWDRVTCCDTGCRHCPYRAGERGAVDGPDSDVENGDDRS